MLRTGDRYFAELREQIVVRKAVFGRLPRDLALPGCLESLPCALAGQGAPGRARRR